MKSTYICFYSLFLCWIYEWPTLSWPDDFRDASKTVSSPPTSPRPGSAATASASTSNIIPPRHQKPAGAPATKKKQQQKKKKGGKGGWWLEHSCLQAICSLADTRNIIKVTQQEAQSYSLSHTHIFMKWFSCASHRKTSSSNSA